MAENGKLPASTLTKLSTPGYLLTPHAAGFERLLKATGTTGTEAPAEAYRSYAEQERVFRENYTTNKSGAADGVTVANGGIKYWDGKTWYRKPGKAVAAVPGTSNHGWGNTVDFQNLGGYSSPKFKAFAPIAREHGWNNEEGAKIGEYWHWVRVDANDQHKHDDEETGVELSEKVTLSEGMKQMAGWSSDTMTVGNLLGYLASASWASGTTGKQAVVELKSVGTKLTEVIRNQEAILAKQDEVIQAIKAIGITAEVTIPDFAIALSGSATKKKATP